VHAAAGGAAGEVVDDPAVDGAKQGVALEDGGADLRGSRLI
jgi:hypothetical protein